MNFFSISSLLGLGLATASALLGVVTMIRALIKPFPFYDPVLLAIYSWGFFLALSGIVLGFGAMWKVNPLRWLAPLSAMTMLIFWVMMASGE